MKMPKSHEELENDLATIGCTKDQDELYNSADEVLDFEDPDEYWSTVDAIELGVRKSKSKNKVFKTEVDQLIYIFIGNFQDIKNKINGLSDKTVRTLDEKKIIVAKIRQLVPEAKYVYFDYEMEKQCKIVTDTISEWAGKIVDGVKIVNCIDPKNYQKQTHKKLDKIYS